MTGSEKAPLVCVKDPAPPWKRFSILIIVLTISLTLGLPSWYLTTSVERAELPVGEIETLNEKYLDNVEYAIPVKIIDLPNTLTGIINETQELINSRLKDSKVSITLLGGDTTVENPSNVYKLKLIMNEDEDQMMVSPYNDKTISLFITPHIIKNNLTTDLISRVLLDTVFKKEITDRATKVSDKLKFPFSDNYKISINFLNSGSKSFDNTGGILQRSIENFESFLNTLKPLANFTIEFQELWYENRIQTIGEHESNGYTIIEDTSMFIDYSDWGLDQDVELKPIINLNLYLPEDEKIRIANSNRNSFIIPQWGGVVIINNDEVLDYPKLNEVFEIFAFQILKLLGISTEAEESLFYRIDEAIRRQTIENIDATLKNFQSLITVINKLKTIPIPLQAVDEVEESVSKIKESIAHLEKLSWLEAYKASTEALAFSSSAFFHKDMVQQAYFPEEHKMAVYSPLLGPFITILTMALIRAVRELRK